MSNDQQGELSKVNTLNPDAPKRARLTRWRTTCRLFRYARLLCLILFGMLCHAFSHFGGSTMLSRMRSFGYLCQSSRSGSKGSVEGSVHSGVDLSDARSKGLQTKCHLAQSSAHQRPVFNEL